MANWSQIQQNCINKYSYQWLEKQAVQHRWWLGNWQSWGISLRCAILRIQIFSVYFCVILMSWNIHQMLCHTLCNQLAIKCAQIRVGNFQKFLLPWNRNEIWSHMTCILHMFLACEVINGSLRKLPALTGISGFTYIGKWPNRLEITLLWPKEKFYTEI